MGRLIITTSGGGANGSSDGDAPVTSVNSEIGDVVLTGDDINVSDLDFRTVASAIDGLENSTEITDTDFYDLNEIKYDILRDGGYYFSCLGSELLNAPFTPVPTSTYDVGFTTQDFASSGAKNQEFSFLEVVSGADHVKYSRVGFAGNFNWKELTNPIESVNGVEPVDLNITLTGEDIQTNTNATSLSVNGDIEIIKTVIKTIPDNIEPVVFSYERQGDVLVTDSDGGADILGLPVVANEGEITIDTGSNIGIVNGNTIEVFNTGRYKAFFGFNVKGDGGGDDTVILFLRVINPDGSMVYSRGRASYFRSSQGQFYDYPFDNRLLEAGTQIQICAGRVQGSDMIFQYENESFTLPDGSVSDPIIVPSFSFRFFKVGGNLDGVFPNEGVV